MEVIIQPNAESAEELVVDFFAKTLLAKPDAVLGLATGRTMEGVYEHLVKRHHDGGLDFSHCRTFNLDEYVGLRADDPNSYRYFMQDRFFRHVNIDTSRTHLPDGMAKDLELECRHYEKLICENGGIDLLLLGIGLNGHLGFNEPFSEFNSRTRMTALTEVTKHQNALLFSNLEKIPRHAITMGVATILEARQCLLLATGNEKADIVAKAIAGPITTSVTASSLQCHPACTMVLDRAAASRLPVSDCRSSKKFVQAK
jgi:glucosamine-6-phosphate deaminase